MTPKNINVKLAEQQLQIEWADGRRSVYELADLRRQCPCAACRTEREAAAQNPLHVLKVPPTAVRATGAKLVGTYAMRFTWSDGHDTGIFEFRFLRSLKTGT